MYLQNVVFLVLSGLFISIPLVPGEKRWWGEQCNTSEDCRSRLTCQIFAESNVCLCPGTLSRGCIALGDICKEEGDCVLNAECSKTEYESHFTCKCTQGTKRNVFNQCEKIPLTFFERLKNFFF